jgi:hypothetical protein
MEEGLPPVKIQNSGDYIFRPLDVKGRLFEGAFYTKLQQVNSSDDSMVFHMSHIDTSTGVHFNKVIVHVSVDQQLQAVKFEVDLGSLP